MLRDLFSLFPAYAGVIPVRKEEAGRNPAFPRIRGGDPNHSKSCRDSVMLFPAYAGVIPGGRRAAV